MTASRVAFTVFLGGIGWGVWYAIPGVIPLLAVCSRSLPSSVQCRLLHLVFRYPLKGTRTAQVAVETKGMGE